MKKKIIFHQFDYYVLLFFSLAFVGWLWEVMLYFFTEHAFINRGVYRGPYLPIYGVGGLLLCFCFGSMKKKPIRVFFYRQYSAACWNTLPVIFWSCVLESSGGITADIFLIQAVGYACLEQQLLDLAEQHLFVCICRFIIEYIVEYQENGA